MRTPVRMFGVMLAALFLAGCLVETKSTIIEDPLPIDARLAGAWARAENGSAWLLMIRPDDDDPALGRVAYVYVSPEDNDIAIERTRFGLRLTKLGARTYFEARPLGPDPFPDSSAPINNFVGWMVFVDPDTLKIEIPNAELITAAIESGQLKGEIDPGNLDKTVTLTGTSAEMRRYFSTSIPADPNGTSIYRRVK